MTKAGEATRSKILDAAEVVLATKGVDAATFSEINQLAEQRNNSAAQYHFGDKVQLLEAVVSRHVARLDERRRELVADLATDPTLHDLVGALVVPLVELLDDASGRRYLVVQAALLSHPDRSSWPAYLAQPWVRPGVEPLAVAVVDSLPPSEDAEIGAIKAEMMTQLLFHSLAGRARGGPSDDVDRYRRALVAALVALLEADFGAG